MLSSSGLLAVPILNLLQIQAGLYLLNPLQACAELKKKRKRRERKKENCDQGSTMEVEEDSAGGERTLPRWSFTDSHRTAGSAITQK
jgi:hypothetical protein